MLRKMLETLFYSPSWAIAYRMLDSQEQLKSELPATDKQHLYHVLDIPKHHMAADPFLIQYNDEIHVFFEYGDLKKSKTTLARKRLYPASDAEPTIIYEFPGHSSYPCIFTWNNKYYIIPETCADSKLVLLYCESWPNVWKEKSVLLEDVVVVDSTPFVYDGKLCLFVYCMDENSKKRLQVAELDVENGTISSLHTVKNYDDMLGRPGRHVLVCGEHQYRVVQPDNNFYGEKIEFWEFSFEKEDGKYYENLVGEFGVSNVKLDKKIPFVGVHTYNKCANIEVIDIRTQKQFDLFRPLKRLLQSFGMFGYNRCDQNKRFINGELPAHLSCK